MTAAAPGHGSSRQWHDGFTGIAAIGRLMGALAVPMDRTT